MSNQDRIEKKTVLRASRARVWRALTDSQEFGSWFGMKVEGAFRAGVKVRGSIVPTTVDEEVARMQKAHEGKSFELEVERLEPETVFAFRWHPFAVDPKGDYVSEPTTLVTFELAEVPEGTRLTVTETGFENLPLARRAAAFAANEGGWTKQMELIEKYLVKTG